MTYSSLQLTLLQLGAVPAMDVVQHEGSLHEEPVNLGLCIDLEKGLVLMLSELYNVQVGFHGTRKSGNASIISIACIFNSINAYFTFIHIMCGRSILCFWSTSFFIN